jgi:hypothetical protein
MKKTNKPRTSRKMSSDSKPGNLSETIEQEQLQATLRESEKNIVLL